MKNKLLIGAHMSTAGGIHNALYEGRDIGCTTVQLFTSNQRQWKARSISQDDVEMFQKALHETGLSHIMSHSSYLINLGAPDHEVLSRSREAFREEIIRCLQLGISYLNFHPGSAIDDPPEKCLEQIVKSLLDTRDLFPSNGNLKLLIETTAGQGSQVGHTFEEIAYIIKQTKDELPIGVCIDTCHIFAAGYDIRNMEHLARTLKEFDKKIGLSFLYAWHLNDSVKGLGSHVDRHEQLGDGELGLDCFRAIMRHPQLRAMPKYLETPGPECWEKEIALLKSFAEE
jgi:deoxyribonuclease IV